jgi:hypothetical protein
LPEGSLFIREIEDQPKVVMREIRFFNPWHHYGRDIHAKEVSSEGAARFESPLCSGAIRLYLSVRLRPHY